MSTELVSKTHLDRLEAEAIYIIREVAAECEKPVMLYSIGKDSSVMLRLAEKAFYPEKPPFPFMHIDTGWKFKEMTSKEKGRNLKWLMLRAVRIRAEMLRNTLFNKCDDCFK